MRILYIVDARSPIAQNWIRHFLDSGDDVHIISTAPCDSFDDRIASFECVPIAFASAVATIRPHGGQRKVSSSRVARRLATNLSKARSMLGAYDVLRHRKAYEDIIHRIAPEIVHAMRIPFEGIVAASAMQELNIPLLVSVWGNDFTLYANESRRIRRMTMRALRRADAIHPDCRRDMDLAETLGWQCAKPGRVLPSAGGIQAKLFRPRQADADLRRSFGVAEDACVVLNPRGLRPYVRNDVFFQAVASIVSERTDIVFLASAMKDEPVAEGWLDRYNLRSSVSLLPVMPRADMARVFAMSDVFVSPSDHDGTPNTLLEGMASGALPVVGAIPSVLEWIEDGHNGITVDQSDVASVARGILRAVDDPQFRKVAATRNLDLIRKRADYEAVMQQARDLYCETIQARSGAAGVSAA